jgi:hypothetical protein
LDPECDELICTCPQSHIDDVRILFETFPHCEIEELLLTIMEHPHSMTTFLDRKIIDQIFSGLEYAIETPDLEALRDIVALTSVILRINFPLHDDFMLLVSPLLLEILTWSDIAAEEPEVSLEEIWRDSLDNVCYMLMNVDPIDPEILYFAIEMQIHSVQDDAICFEDHLRAIEFLIFVSATTATLRPDQVEIIETFLKERVETEDEEE